MLSARRLRKFARPRHAAMWVSRELTHQSFPEIAQRFRRRNHTSVIHAIHSVDHLIQVDTETWELVRDSLIDLNGHAPEFELHLNLGPGLIRTRPIREFVPVAMNDATLEFQLDLDL
jgi:hypothetical protein